MAIAAHFLPPESSPETGTTPREPRRHLLLETEGATPAGEAGAVLVHNISATGLLLESEIALAVGERIEIDLPEAPGIWASVVWASETVFGCRFDHALSAAALSAAQLRGIAAEEAGMPALAVGQSGESLGRRLARLRKARGLSLGDLASTLGVSKPTVWAWEHGKAQPIEARMAALAAALGVEQEELQVGDQWSVRSELVARCRSDIARAFETSIDRIRIAIEL